MNNFHNVLIEAKNEYTKQLTRMLAPCIFEGLESVYDYVQKDNKNNQYLKEFQNHLSDIPKWTKDMIIKEYDRVILKINCDWIEDLITAVFVSHTKVLTAIKMTDKSNSIDLKVPNGHHFLHKCYIESARQIWKRPYLFDHKLNNLEKQRNLNEAENIIIYSIEETVRNLLPVRTILKEYLGTNYEDDLEDDISQHIPRAHQNNLKNMVKKEIELSLNNIDNVDDNDDNYSNYKLESEILEKNSIEVNSNKEVDLISLKNEGLNDNDNKKINDIESDKDNNNKELMSNEIEIIKDTESYKSEYNNNIEGIKDTKSHKNHNDTESYKNGNDIESPKSKYDTESHKNEYNKELMNNDIVSDKIGNNIESMNNDIKEINNTEQNTDINKKMLNIGIEKNNDIENNEDIELYNSIEKNNDIENNEDIELYNSIEKNNDIENNEDIELDNSIEKNNDIENNEDIELDNSIEKNNDIENNEDIELDNSIEKNNDIENDADIENINKYTILELEEELNKIADKGSLTLASNLDNNIFYNDAIYYKN